MLTQWCRLTDTPVQLPATVTTLTLSSGKLQMAPFENRGKVATLYSITLDLFFFHCLLFPLFPINFSCCRWTDRNTIYITQCNRNRANKICETHSPKQHLLVSVCRLIESLCAVNSVECSLTNILTYLAQLVLH